MDIGWPQIIIICFYVIILCNNAYRHGERKYDETYNVFDAIVGIILSILLLWWGGFWT